MRVVAVILALLLLMPLAYHLYRADLSAPGASAEVVFSLIAAPTVFVWLWWIKRGDAVALYAGGIGCRHGNEVWQLGWREVRSLREAVVMVRSDEDNYHPAAQLSIETRDGRVLDLAWLVDMHELWDEIGKEVARLEVPRQLSLIQAGEAAEFGPFRLEAHRLTVAWDDAVRFVPWPDVTEVLTVNARKPEDGARIIEVWTRGQLGTEDCAAVPRLAIPNFHTFYALCRQLRGKAPALPGR